MSEMAMFQQLRRYRTTRRDRGTSQVKYNKGDEQFDIGRASAIFAMDSLVCAPQFTNAELVKVDHPRADQRCLHHPQLLASFAVFAGQ
jgi:hypothetical protein